MQIPQKPLKNTLDYVDRHRDDRIDNNEPEFNRIFGLIRRFHNVDSTTRVLEIGPGTGWLSILCHLKGIPYKGLELDPSVADFAKEYGRRYGVELDIELGNVEDANLGESVYDVVIASSVFEHVEHWRVALKRVFKALKPGGVLYFSSTNKFCLKSGEYHFPLYGWMPRFMRYWLRRRRQGPDIMVCGIDFHQFTYASLRRAFRNMGATRVVDRLDLLDPDAMKDPRPWKQFYLKCCRRFKLLKIPALCLFRTTEFVCVK